MAIIFAAIVCAHRGAPASADALSRTILESPDDAEQAIATGLVDTDDARLQLGITALVARIAGLRFQDIAIPRGAHVTGARLVFTADDTDALGASFDIEGVDAIDPGPFTTGLFDVSARPRTTASVDWNGVPAWINGASGAAQTTPELTAIVQELVNRADWIPGGAMVFLLDGIGNRDARSADSGSGAASLEIEFDLPAAPDIVFRKAAAPTSDPVNGNVDPKTIPGSTVRYHLTAANYGGVTDADSVTIVEPVPGNTRLYVDDLTIPGSGPLAFTDGGIPSGLAYGFTALSHPLDDIDFSNDGGANFTYVPVPGTDGTDAAVTHVRINPKGSFNAASAGNAPSFELAFQVLVN